MGIDSLLKNNANVQIVISALDLHEAFMQWASEVIQKDTERQERFLETKQAANMFGLDVNKLRIWRKQGYLKCTKIGGKSLYKQSDIKELIVNEYLSGMKKINKESKGLDKESGKGKTITLFIAQCGDKYLYEWVKTKESSYVWFKEPSKFDTKSELLECLRSAFRNKERPNEPILIKELRETVIDDVVNEEYWSDEKIKEYGTNFEK